MSNDGGQVASASSARGTSERDDSSRVDEMIFTLAWIAKRRLDAVPLAISETNRPAEFIAASTGVDVELVSRVMAFFDDPRIWSFGDTESPLLGRWMARCHD
jgi:hypothetical protein